MIINFSVQNFGSIKEKQTLSFEAMKSNHLEDSYVIHTNGLRLLKIALIYGANASGKTTILKALNFLRDIVVKPATNKTDELDFQPFLFDTETPNQNSVISIQFITNDTKYFYEVEFFKKAVVREELNYYHPKKANIFERTTDLENKFTQIKFGGKIKIDKTIEKILEANTLWNNTVLGGFLKTNVEIKELQNVTEWFNNYLHSLIFSKTQLEGFVSSNIDRGKLLKTDVISILKKADFHISDIVFQKKEEILPEGWIESLMKLSKVPIIELKKLKQEGRNISTNINIEFEHIVNQSKYLLPFKVESEGTKRFYGLAGLLTLSIKNSVAFLIDELESSLHPDLYIHFIVSFLLNTNKSQIIATTHNREFFNFKDLFRNDAIWFTDKNEFCSTELYSLADYDSSIVRNTTNIYNAYKSGKLRATPNLGDTFINLE